jgi:hypothetical protein
MAESKTSPWLWIGCGCLVAIGCIVLAIGGFMFMGFRWAQNVQETMEDPVARDAKVREILACDELPEGYHPLAGFGIPFFLDLAVLSSQEHGEGPPGKMGERGFIYMKIRNVGDVEQQLSDLVDGTAEKRPDIFVQSNVSIDTDEVVTRGELDLEGSPFRYAVHRGGVAVEGSTADGLATLMLFECPSTSHVRFGIWFSPEADHPGASDPLAGTAGDVDGMAEFVSHFEICD